MKIFTAFIAGIFLLGACSNDSDSSSIVDNTSAAIAWNVLTDEEHAILCNMYVTEEKTAIVGYFTSEPDAITQSEAEAFYSVMNEEC